MTRWGVTPRPGDVTPAKLVLLKGGEAGIEIRNWFFIRSITQSPNHPMAQSPNHSMASFIPQRHHGIDLRRAAGREKPRGKRGCRKSGDRNGKDRRVVALYAIEFG